MVAIASGEYEIGASGRGFAYDNERPRHTVELSAFEVDRTPVTNGAYISFMEETGTEPPLYWERDAAGRWTEFTLGGTRLLHGAALSDPVVHVSFYEADAFARWAGHRLPTEFEWEAAARGLPVEGTFVDSESFHPRAASGRGAPLEQLYGDTWQWTQSAYVGYPNFRPAPAVAGTEPARR